MSTSNISNRSVSTKTSEVSRTKTTKPSMVKKLSLDENSDITIRLSDLGIIERSPSQLNLRLQAEKVSYILENTIQRLQIAVCLPRLLRCDACLLRRLLEPHDVDFILGICNKYLISTDFSIINKWSIAAVLNSIDKISMNESNRKSVSKHSSTKTQKNFADPHMAHVMQILWNSRSIKEMVLREFGLISKNPCTVLVNGIKTLKEIAEFKFSVTAIEERNREKHLRKAWKANSLIEESIQKTQELLNKQRKDLGKQLEAKKTVVLDYQSRLDTLKHKMNDDIKHTVMESEKEMAEDTELSVLRQADLSTEAKAVAQQYETLLNQHMGIEKMLRAKRFKVETQLCSWLTKYDADIGERQAEFEEITKGYEAEKAEMDAIQDLIIEHDEEYQRLMQQKDEEEQEMWEARAYAYLKTRSARKIQRCWREYRQRKIDRKKAKKAKALEKKRKAEEKAARKEAGEAEPKQEKAPKGKKDKGKGKKGKKDKLPPSEARGPDFQAALEDKFGGDLLGDLQGEEFSKKEVVVDLAEGLTE